MDKLQSSPVVQRLVALIPYRHNRSSQRRVCGAWAVGLLGLSSVLLCFSAGAPAWAVTRFDGQGTLGPLSYEVDVIIGDGLWTRNQCWGDYNEELLQSVGLTCKGTPQLQGCDNPAQLSQDQVDNCETMALAQSMQLFAIFCSAQALFAMLVASWVARRVPALVVGAVFAFFSSYAASSVTAVLRDSYMFKATGMQYECMQVLSGLGEVCHGVGPSLGFQNMAVFFLTISSAISLILACTKHEEEDVSMIRAPLMVVAEDTPTVASSVADGDEERPAVRIL